MIPTSHLAQAQSATASAVLAATTRLAFDHAFIQRLMEPKEVIHLRLSPRLSDGLVHNIPTTIVRHSDWLGPAKGGIRMAGDVDEATVRDLALDMTIKTALMGIPFGGGKTGIRINPTELTAEDKELVIRNFANRARRHLGPDIYVPAPDIGTSEREMGYIKDSIAYGQGRATTQGCFVTGKPVVLGGIPGRREATGTGVAIALQAYLQDQGQELSGQRLIVQGLGNVGIHVALEAINRGATIVAVSDHTALLDVPDGIDVIDVQRHLSEHGVLSSYPGAKPDLNASIYAINADIFVPAAVGGVLDRDSASRLRVSVVVEAANGPCTPEGDEVLNDRRIAVIPDVLCNAGGVLVSYLEYIQETQREQWEVGRVRERLEHDMVKRLHQVTRYAKDHDLTLRRAAVECAVVRLHEAIQSRGLLV